VVTHSTSTFMKGCKLMEVREETEGGFIFFKNKQKKPKKQNQNYKTIKSVINRLQSSCLSTGVFWAVRCT